MEKNEKFLSMRRTFDPSCKILKIMKLVFLFVLVGTLQLSASVYSQTTKLNVNLKNVSLKQVLEELEKQTDMTFLYSDSNLDVNKAVTVVAHNKTLEQILDDLFRGKSVHYSMIENHVIITVKETPGTANAQQQKFTVTGKVTNDVGDPIPGVNVYEKSNPSHGVITTVDGTYSITINNKDAILVFSFIGYENQEIHVAGRTEINVTMVESSQNIDEVVVTALGIKRDIKQLGYAMTEVNGKDIAEVNTVSPVEALKGKSAGVSIGQSDGGLFGKQKILVRGVSVMNSKNNNPIYVIDGVILESGVTTASADWSGSTNDWGDILKNLNPDDFKSVSILKGAAATALYGSRGINGAIVIETKDGTGTRGIGVKVTQSIGIDNVYNQPDIQYEFGPGALAGYTNYGEKDENGNYYRFSTNQFYTNADGIPTKIGHPWEWAGYGPKYDGRDIIDYDGTMTKYLPAKNNLLDAFDNGFNSNTAVSLRGGNAKGNFYLSDSYNYREGIYPTDQFTRNSLQFSGSYKLADWLEAYASVSFTTSIPENPRNDISTRFTLGNWVNWYDTKKWNRREVWQAPHGGVPRTKYGDEYAYVPGNNVWFAYHLNESKRTEQVTRPIIRIKADITKWLSATLEGNMNHYTIFSETKNLGQGYAMDGGSYSISHKTTVSHTGKFHLDIHKNISENITSNLIVGGEIWDTENSYSYVRTDGGLIVPGKFYMGNSKKTLRSNAYVGGTKQINSVYFMANFGWKDQLFLDITGRNDWSSALVYSDGTGNYSYFYPSISTSWIFNETLNLPQWVSFGKLRFSWAQVGNDTSPYYINQGYRIGKVEMENSKFVYSNYMSSTQVDPNIKPERKNSIEAGLDIRFFMNRIGIDFAYYNETITEQIGSVPLPGESGLGGLLTNVGTMTNKGIELSVRLVPVRTNNFEWTSTINYWRNRTEISDLHESYGAYRVLDGYVNYGNYRVGSVAYDGGEYGILMSDTKPLEWNNENDPNDPRNGMPIFKWRDDRRGAYYERSYEVQQVGKLMPDFEGSWDNKFSFKGLTVDILLDSRFGGYIGSFNNKYGTSYGWMETSLKYRDEEHGGLSWTSHYSDTDGQEFHDGVIPEGVFKEGQIVTAPNGQQVDVGGMTYQEAYDAGYIEPTHASLFNYFTSSWSSGVINDNWFNEVKYIALRNISVGYSFPKKIASAVKAQNLYLGFNARNLGYLYNSLPNNLNPESFRGTSSSGGFLERVLTPYKATYTFTLSIDF